MERIQSLTTKGLLASAFVLGALTQASTSAKADLITYYNFNSVGTNTSGATVASSAFPIAASNANGSLTTNFTANTIIQNAGSTINAQSASLAGLDLSFQNGGPDPQNSSVNVNSGKYFQFQFSSLGFSGLLFTTAERVSNLTKSPTSALLSYSLDGTTFTDTGFNVRPGTLTAGNYALVTQDLSSITALNNQPSVYLRVTFSGGSAASGDASSNIRFDNLAIATTPAPSSLLVALVGVPGVGLMIRRRRAAK